jgi:RNA polymerase sigma-70 factor (ECF subfamily)
LNQSEQGASDRELVQRVLILDDRNAYSALVRKYQSQIRAYLYRRTRDREWADDLAQEAFLQGYRSIHQLSGGDRFRGWLFTIAHRQFLQAYRSRTNEHQSIDNWPGDGVVLFEPVSSAGLDERAEVQALLSSLRANEQEAIILCLGYEFTHPEAAEILGLSVGTVKSLVLRAREKLRDGALGTSNGGSNG